MRKVIFACSLFAAWPAFSQDVTGSISGTVQDSSGGAVSNAKISVTNTDQNLVVKTLTTGNSGEYAATQLAVGTYTVSAEAAGFKRALRTAIAVNVNDKLTVNFTMDVGAVTEEVKVEESPLQVEMQSVAAQDLITGTQVRELSLNTRNYEQLLQLSPGVVSNVGDQLYIGVSTPVGSSTVGFSINGSRPGANNWTVDGADNVDRGSNQTLLNYPSVDAIAEFKVLRGQYDAEFGRALGGQINVVTKSGTNGFHGDAYEFFRNDKLAANNYFNNLNGVNPDPQTGKARVPPLRYNNFGYTIGGPVWIPKVYNRERNKTFFFFSEEFRRVITYGTTNTIAPTAAQKNGQFATPVCISFSADGTQCLQTGTQIPNINPVAQAYIKDIFNNVPNGAAFGSAAGEGSLFTALRNQAYARQELIKIDHNFGQKLVLSGRYVQDSIPTIEPGGLFTGLSLPNVATTNTNAPGKGLVIRATSSFTPNLVNEGGYAYSYGAIISTVAGIVSTSASPDVKVTLPYATTIARIPSLAFAGGGSSITGFGPYNDYNRNHQVFDSLTWVHGRHTFKFGGTYYHYNKQENAGNGNQGTFTFSGEGTAVRPAGTNAFDQSFANFLLGRVSNYSQNQYDLTPSIKSSSFELYAQDQYRLRPNLTLSYGLRYSVFYAPYDANKFLTNFDPKLYDPAKAPQINAAGNIIPNTGDPLNGLIINSQNSAFGHPSPFGDKVSNYGKNNLAPRVGIAWDPMGDGKMSIRTGYGIFYDTALYGIYEQNVFANTPFNNTVNIPNTNFANPGSGTPSISAAPMVLHSTPYDFNTPYSQQWSFDVQRQLGRGLVVDAGYYGQKATHLLGIRDINEVQPGLAYSSGVIAPNTYVTSATTPRLNALRPYRGYAAINALETNYNEEYNSLQLNVQKRFSGNTQVGVAYTWSKGMGDTRTDRSNAPQNSYDVRSERARIGIDRTNVATANFVIDVPGFRAQKGFLGHALGGWEISGIASFQSGLPLTVTSSSGNDPAGLGLLGASAASPRPDAICNPNGSAGAPRSLSKWFNTSCFAEVPLGQYRPGNAGQSIVRGPGLQKWDMSLFKNFHLPFTEQTSLQVRGEAFNIFNHTNYNSVNTTFGSSLFGRVTATRDPRIVQLAAKLYF